MPLHLVWMGFKKYFSLIRKTLLVFVTLFVVFTLFSAFINADRRKDSVGKPTVAQIEEARRLQTYERLGEQSDSKYSPDTVALRQFDRFVLCKLTGELCTSNPKEAHKYKQQSFSGFASSVLVMPLQNPPSSFYYVARSTIENAGFLPKTYAAGIGFNALSSYQPVWKAFRNLSYMVIVLVIVGVGFMVMFGIGGGGKTAVTLESALPRLVIALLAISFSYAIAGLLVDLMYISIALIMSYFGPIAGYSGAEAGRITSTVLGGAGPSYFLFDFLWAGVTTGRSNFWELADSLIILLPPVVQSVIESVIDVFSLKLLVMFGSSYKPGLSTGNKSIKAVLSTIKNVLAQGLSPLSKLLDKTKDDGGGVMGMATYSIIALFVIEMLSSALLGGFIMRLVLSFILICGLIFVFFKIFFTFVLVYIDIFLSIVTAPLVLILDAIPGQNGLMKWIRGLAVNLAVFPLSIGIVLLVRVIINSSYSIEEVWKPPFINVVQEQGHLQLIVGGVLLYSLPQLIKAFRKKMGGESMLGSLNLGIGSLLVGATPFVRGIATVTGASGIQGALARRVTDPVAKMFNLQTRQVVELAPDSVKTGGKTG